MPKRLPEHAELYFVETLSTGTVHIEARVPVWATLDDPVIDTIRMGDGTGRVLAALLGTPTVVRCGQRTFPSHPGDDARHKFTGRFRDEQLCAACYRTLTVEDQSRAFEHEQPGEEGDGG
jgi:hypothetical protein